MPQLIWQNLNKFTQANYQVTDYWWWLFTRHNFAMANSVHSNHFGHCQMDFCHTQVGVGKFLNFHFHFKVCQSQGLCTRGITMANYDFGLCCYIRKVYYVCYDTLYSLLKYFFPSLQSNNDFDIRIEQDAILAVMQEI